MTPPIVPPIVAAVREFVDREVRSQAPGLEHADAYPHAMVGRMKALGLFGALVPKDFGGLGVEVTIYARIIEELCRGWMSLAGVINSHTMAALIVLQHGTDEQRARLLPRFARGEARGGLCLTEPHAGSDVQAIRTVARRRGAEYVLDGSKMFVTNGREGNTFALLALTDPKAEPRHRGMSCFIVEKGHPGLRVAKSIAKLGYKGVDTAELVFEEFVVPAANLVGGVEGRGFKHVMSGLETGRINIAARAVGVARATWDDTLAHARATDAAPDPRLADMAGQLHSARLITYWAAGMKERGERCDLEAGMAKLHASETAQTLAEVALRVVGERAILATSNLERYYRDTPLMIIGEGTNEIQRTIIARNLVDRYGERAGALAPDGGAGEQRQMVLAVRQLVDKDIAPNASDHEQAGRSAAVVLGRVADLGVLAGSIPTDEGGLALSPLVCAALLEELARGWASLAAIVASHVIAVRALAMPGALPGKRSLLGNLGRGDTLASTALGGTVTLRRDGDDVILSGQTQLADGAARADIFVVAATADDGRRTLVAVPTVTRGLRVGPAEPVLGLRGADGARVAFGEVRIGNESLLPDAAFEDTLAFAHLATAAIGVGLAQASFEAALRYAQQRTAFGKPINQHQAIQLKLADMATAVTAARLLVADADVDPIRAALAKLQATATATRVTLESMRTHGGYGYTAEFPVERHYRDAARLLAMPIPEDETRAAVALALRERG